MKKIMSLIITMVMVAAILTGFSTSTSSSKVSAAAKKHSFAFVTSSLNNPFFSTISDTFKKLCKEKGDDYVILDPQYDQSKQISMIEDEVTKGVDAIFVIAVDSAGIKPALEKAKSKGIPVISIDNPVTDRNLVASVVASDNYNAGVLCGKTMAKDLPKGGKIAIIDFPTAQACVDRVNGFFKGLGTLKSKFKVVAQQDGGASLEKSMPIADAMIQANPDIKAFFCINDPTALGTIAALKADKKLKGMKIYAVDGSPDAKKALLDGTLNLTVAQSPVNLAKTSYNTALKVLNGETVQKNVKVPTFKIDKSNVKKYGTGGWQ